jgi:hypothetical protein
MKSGGSPTTKISLLSYQLLLKQLNKFQIYTKEMSTNSKLERETNVVMELFHQLLL